MIAIVSINTHWHCVEAGGVVCGRIIARVTVATAITVLPSQSRGQRLGKAGIVAEDISTARVLVLAFYIVFQLCPLFVAGHMPAIGADALHLAGIGVAGCRTMHRRRPVIQISALGQREELTGTVATETGEVIVIGFRFAEVRKACGNGGAVGVVRGTQIGAHPALLAKLHSAVCVAVNIRNRRSTRTGFFVYCVT